MRTRIGNVSDCMIRVALLLLLLVLLAASVAGKARANLHQEARADGCFAASVEEPKASDVAE